MRIGQGLSKIVQKNSIRTVLGSSVPWYWERRNVPEKRRNEFHAKDATIAKRGSALLFLYWESSCRNFKKTTFLPTEFSRSLIFDPTLATFALVAWKYHSINPLQTAGHQLFNLMRVNSPPLGAIQEKKETKYPAACGGVLYSALVSVPCSAGTRWMPAHSLPSPRSSRPNRFF